MFISLLSISKIYTMKTSNLLPLLAVAAMLASCSSRPEQADLVLLYTTDIHGACLPFDIRRNAPAKTSMANVCTYVEEQREQHPDAVMLFDTGDFLQGQPSMYYYNYVATDASHIVAETYNYLQYDALGVGNHDIETGEAVYHDRLPNQFQMPWLCANAIDQRTGEPMFQPYCIINRQGIKVAILGMITPNIAAWLPKQLWPNLEFEDMVECAQHWIPIIQEKEKPDVIVGLFHSGHDYNSNGNNIDTYKNENGGVAAAIKVPGFDIVLCGHDHQVSLEQVVNVKGDTVQVLDAQTQAAKVGRADIHLALDKQTGKYQKQTTTSLVEMKDYAPSEKFAEKFQYAVDEVNAYVDKPLGELTASLYGEESLLGPSTFIDFIHEVQLWSTGADISLASVLTPHDSVSAGPITMRQLFTLYKYENLLFCVRMTGEEVRRYLDFGFDRQFGLMKNANDHLLAFLTNEQGNVMTDNFGPRFVTPTFNFTCAAGIRYTLDVSKPKGERLTIHSMSDGTPFDPAKEYKVAINSYQASGGGGFVTEGLGWDDNELEKRLLSTTQKDVRRYVAEYIEEHKTINPQLRGDWEIVPQAWWQRGAERDRKFINSNQR